MHHGANRGSAPHGQVGTRQKDPDNQRSRCWYPNAMWTDGPDVETANLHLEPFAPGWLPSSEGTDESSPSLDGRC